MNAPRPVRVRPDFAVGLANGLLLSVPLWALIIAATLACL